MYFLSPPRCQLLCKHGPLFLNSCASPASVPESHRHRCARIAPSLEWPTSFPPTHTTTHAAVYPRLSASATSSKCLVSLFFTTRCLGRVAGTRRLWHSASSSPMFATWAAGTRRGRPTSRIGPTSWVSRVIQMASWIAPRTPPESEVLEPSSNCLVCRASSRASCSALPLRPCSCTYSC